MNQPLLDVLIIGAGVSGIAMATALKRQCPEHSFAILDQRARIGGTWDLFRYPGVRSDSDLTTYAFRHHPWPDPKILAGGEQIRSYLANTAQSAGITDRIQQGIRVRTATWSTKEACWTVITDSETSNLPQHYRARFLVMGTGYYDHDIPYLPTWPGTAQFEGRLVHPQHWPESLEVAGQRIVVIGSGATAVSLAPELAARGAHVTVLQRSPGYLINSPSINPLSRFLPVKFANALARRLLLTVNSALYNAARRFPIQARRVLLKGVRAALPAHHDVRDFEPRYSPWDQRLCIVADGDLFREMRAGRLQVVTDEIETFDATGIRTTSGHRLDADIVVAATGLRLKALGGITFTVDGQPWRSREHMLYRGVLPEGLPNVAWMFGYINQSWTLKADLAASYVCRLLRHMQARGIRFATPVDNNGCRMEENIMSALRSGYVQRGDDELPRQGRTAPWRVAYDLALDRKQLLRDPIEDGVLRFDGQPSTLNSSVRSLVPPHNGGPAFSTSRH